MYFLLRCLSLCHYVKFDPLRPKRIAKKTLLYHDHSTTMTSYHFDTTASHHFCTIVIAYTVLHNFRLPFLYRDHSIRNTSHYFYTNVSYQFCTMVIAYVLQHRQLPLLYHDGSIRNTSHHFDTNVSYHLCTMMTAYAQPATIFVNHDESNHAQKTSPYATLPHGAKPESRIQQEIAL